MESNFVVCGQTVINLDFSYRGTEVRFADVPEGAVFHVWYALNARHEYWKVAPRTEKGRQINAVRVPGADWRKPDEYEWYNAEQLVYIPAKR